jgi:dipeptidyl aminopeptidase/acylaminoacyl peptidase
LVVAHLRIAAGITWAVAALATARASDLEAYLQVPFPSQLVSAHGAEKLAWIANEKGVRNVWTAESPKYIPRQLTRWTQDDGIELSSLQLSRDGSTLVWVRGGHPDDAGFSQNPQSLPAGVEQEIWISAHGEAAHRLASGDSPVISPDGSVVLFTQGQTISCRSATDAQAPRWCSSPMLKLRGENRQPIFSPDGRRVAFVSDRKDHSFIGVLDTVTDAVTWLKPDASRDDFPAWSPDGRHLAFLRISGERFGETLDITGAWPFEIWIADAITGSGKRVFRSNAQAGGFAQIDNEGPSRQPLRWTSSNRLLFYSEESGWIHLYQMSPEGGLPQDLTPGDCEAESDALAAGGSTLIVSSNCASIDGRQLFEVSVDGGKPRRLVGSTIDVEPVYIGATQSYAYRSANAASPTSIVVAGPSMRPNSIFPVIPAGFPVHELVKPDVVTFQAADGLIVHGQLFRPASPRSSGSRNAVIFLHGGPVRQMLPGWHYMDYYNNSYAMNQYLASLGFVVLSINYRGGTGYGQAFRRAKDQGPRGVSEYQDVLAGRAFLTSLPEVDPKRIGIYGGSYGGYLVATALARNSDLFAAGVDFHGVHDWAQKAKESPGAGWGLDPSLYDRAYQSSPVADVGTWRSPALFIHGDDDRSVPFDQTTDLVSRLREANVPVETLIFPDEEHGFLRYASWLQAYRATADFLTRTLGPGGSGP